jgi:hypothetical protein
MSRSGGKEKAKKDTADQMGLPLFKGEMYFESWEIMKFSRRNA